MPRFSVASQTAPLNWPQVYLGISLTTLATMVLELSLSRIFSVVFYYHFAFLVISLALFGLGGGGLFSYLFRGRSKKLFRNLGVLAAANSGVVVLTLAYVLTRQGELDSGTLALVYLTSALPFFLAGTIISTAVAETVERVDRVYFFDLIGAAVGCLMLVPLLDLFGGPNTVIGAAILFAAAAAIWFTLGASPRGRAAAVVVALGLVALIVLNMKQSLIDVRYAKGERLHTEFYVKWNSFSRVALTKDEKSGKVSIHTDADSVSRIADVDFGRLSANSRRRLLASGAGLAHLLRPAAKTLVIGPGGGEDLALALAAGSHDVTGVEINPIIATTIMRERFAGLSRGLYLRPEVRIVVGDGRSFIHRNEERYEVLRVSQAETWASSQAGAHALSETNLYTTEAFEDYLRHLTADGVLAFTYWSYNPPRESLRLVTLALSALARLGEGKKWEHFIVVRDEAGGRPLDTVLVGRSPFPASDAATVRRAVAESALEVVYLPGDTSGSPFAKLLRGNEAEYLADYPYDVSPVDDNRPFFFYTAEMSDVVNFLSNRTAAADGPAVNPAVPLLFRLVGVSLLATAIVLILPPVFLGGRLPRRDGVARFLWYFVFIGVGYMLVQVSLIQKFVLFLEHPTYALTVIIFSMLVSSGLGSFYSRRFVRGSDRGLMGVLATVALLVALLAVLIPPLTNSGSGWPLAIKAILTVLLTAPSGFVMGMAFPAGLARLEKRHQPSVRWAWALNAAASVLGSAMAVFLAIHLGLRETLLVGGVMYLGALISVGPAPRDAARRAEA